MRASRVPVLITVLLCAALAVRLRGIWHQLPARMATHFGADGVPNDWMSPGGFLAFMLLVGGGVVAFLFASPYWLTRVPPEMINVPYANYWLTPERRAASAVRMGQWLAWFGVVLTLLFLVVTDQVVRANLRPDQRDVNPTWPLLVGFLSLTAAWLAAFYWRFRPPQAQRSD